MGVPQAAGSRRLSVSPLRNLFTCGGATDDCGFIYAEEERREEDFPFRQPCNINRAEGKCWSVLLKHNHYKCSTWIPLLTHICFFPET